MNTATRRAQHRATSSAGLQPHHMALASLSLISTIPAVWIAAQVSARLDGARPPDGVGFEAVVEAVTDGIARLRVPAFGTVVEASVVGISGALTPGETVTLSLSIQNVGSTNATNVVGTLLATNGVSSPSAAQRRRS